MKHIFEQIGDTLEHKLTIKTENAEITLVFVDEDTALQAAGAIGAGLVEAGATISMK